MEIVELEKLDDNKKEKDINQRFINEEKFESKIPIAASKASSIPVKKVKTIKKHSKVRRDLNVQDVVQHRPTVGDIEWGEEKKDTEREVEDIDDDEEEVEDDDEQDIDPNDVIKEISTLALEDVQQLSSLDQSDPIVLISSGDDDYSGDIDEFILIEAPNNYTQARQMQQRQQQEQPYHENKTIKTTTMREFDSEGRETVTIRREERGPDGEVVITEETHDSNDYPPTHGSHTINSGSDTDDQLSPVDEIHEQILTQNKYTENSRGQSKMLGSSSGSDVALHEPGVAESSEDETGAIRKTQTPEIVVDECEPELLEDNNDILVSEQPITTTETDTNVEEIVNEDGSTTIVKTTTVTTNTVVTTHSEEEPQQLLY